MKSTRFSTAVRVALIYALFGLIWVAASDMMLAAAFTDHALVSRLQTYKGWVFVAASAFLIYFLLKRDLWLQEQAEQALRKSEEEYRFLFENNPHPMWVYDQETLAFLWVNQAAITKYGYTREEFMNMTIADIRPAEDVPRLEENPTQPRPPLQYSTGWRHRLKDGAIIHVEITSSLLEVNGRKAVLVVAEDVTERKTMEEALRHSEERYRSTLNNMLEGCQIIDFDWRYIYINEAAARQGRKSPKELLMHTMMEAYPGIENTKLFDALRTCMEQRVSAHIENQFEYSDGTSGWFELSIQPVPEGIFILSIDVTERKKAEQALRESEERFRQLAENIDAVFWITEAQTGRELYVSPGYKKVWGRDPQSLIRNPAEFLESLWPEDRTILQDAIERQKKGESTKLEYRIRLPDGSVRWVWDRSFPIFDQTGEVTRIVGIASDITARKQFETKISEQLNRINALKEIDRVILSSLDLQLTMSLLLEHVVEQLNVDAAAILQFDPNTHMLTYIAELGMKKQGLIGQAAQLGDSLAGKTAVERRMIAVSNLKDEGYPAALANFFSGENFAAYHGLPLIAKGQLKGVLEVFQRTPSTPDAEWLHYLETLAGQAAIALDSIQLFDAMQRSNQELLLAYDATIEGWSRALDLRDRETEGHTQRVTEMAVALAREFGIGGDEIQHIRWGGLLHDIGKMGVPDSILLKADKLNAEEWELMQKHPSLAYEMLKPIRYLKNAVDIPYCHHEKWDGTGYPRGLKGEQIPLPARIFAIVDIWDALRSDRPYRPKWSETKTLKYIKEISGTHLDPQVVEKFFQTKIYERSGGRAD